MDEFVGLVIAKWAPDGRRELSKVAVGGVAQGALKASRQSLSSSRLNSSWPSSKTLLSLSTVLQLKIPLLLLGLGLGLGLTLRLEQSASLMASFRDRPAGPRECLSSGSHLFEEVVVDAGPPVSSARMVSVDELSAEEAPLFNAKKASGEFPAVLFLWSLAEDEDIELGSGRQEPGRIFHQDLKVAYACSHVQ